jgi:DNA-binding MarR family transcriptional regulator
MNASQKELEILENVYNSSSHVSQRDLARIADLSLGMTNTILKRLAQKGWITIRKVNNRNIHYVVTPTGMDIILRKSYRYFKRTIKNVVFYREAIESLIKEVAEIGYEGVVLVGRSDLDFIVEHACRRFQLPLLHEDPEEDGNGGIFYLYAETYIPDDEEEEEAAGRAYLQKVLIQ